ncbi:MAG: hypothetical protein HEQ37_02005 [Acidovorax sp.]|nr:hypothetical protein [Acidovorax sp.]
MSHLLLAAWQAWRDARNPAQPILGPMAVFSGQTGRKPFDYLSGLL